MVTHSDDWCNIDSFLIGSGVHQDFAVSPYLFLTPMSRWWDSATCEPLDAAKVQNSTFLCIPDHIMWVNFWSTVAEKLSCRASLHFLLDYVIIIHQRCITDRLTYIMLVA